MIRELEAREIEKIYREEMTGDFPAEELKPIDLILRLKAEGRYCAFGNFEGEKLTAYAFLIHEKDDPVYLLDFFAVCRGGRDQGIGSTFIRELLHKLNPEFWILEVEDIASAANEEEREIRTRRMDFYHKRCQRYDDVHLSVRCEPEASLPFRKRDHGRYRARAL